MDEFVRELLSYLSKFFWAISAEDLVKDVRIKSFSEQIEYCW